MLCGGVEFAARAQSSPTPSDAPAQAGAAANYVLGDITAISAPDKRITIRTEKGETVAAILYDRTEYLRIPPGETNLKNKQPITLADVSIGDRAMAWGRVAEDGKSVRTRQLVVISKVDLTRKRERERDEWNRRGVVGIISAVNPATKEIILNVRAEGVSRPLTVEAGAPNLRFRRYAPDSIKFDDARPSSFDELKAGDVLRALGEKNAEATRLVPEEIVSGSFRMVGGSIVEINPGATEIKIKDSQTGQPLSVRIIKNSMMRRLPPEVVAMLAQRRGPQPANGPNSSTTPTPAPAATAPGAAQAGAAQARAGGNDIQEILERLPPISLSDLKTGDMVLVSSTTGAEPSRVTAIMLVAGVEVLLNNAAPRQPGRSPQSPALSIPGLDVIGLGLP